MLLEIPGCPEDLFGNHFSNMKRLDSMLQDYEIVITGKAWKFGSQLNNKDLVFVVERRNVDQREVTELHQYFLAEGYTVDDLDEDARSFSKEDGAFQVDCIITSENALATVFDSGKAPRGFRKARFWHGIYGVYSGDLWFPGSKDFVYGSCALTKYSMKRLKNEFDFQVAGSICKALTKEVKDEGTATLGSC